MKVKSEKVKLLSRVQLLEIPWTAADQAPPSMGFSRQEYWSGVPLPFLEGHNLALTMSLCSPSLTDSRPCDFLEVLRSQDSIELDMEEV